ncbi:MAG: PaaI family thioesterase [Geminicoccaceae bacterium]
MAHNSLTIADIQERIGRSKFHQLFRPEVLELDNEAMTLALKVHMRPEFERQPGTGHWHGGALASLIDIAGCYALMLVAGGQMLTLNFSTDFLRLAVSDHLIARAVVRKVGRTVGFVDVEIEDADGLQVVMGRACYTIRPDIKQT